MSAPGGLWTCPRPHARPARPRRSTRCWRSLCACAGSGRDAPTTLTLTPLLLLARGAARGAGEPGARALGRAAGGAGQPRQRERERDPGRRAARQRPPGRPGRRDDVRQGQDPERVRAGRRQRAVCDRRQVRAAAPGRRSRRVRVWRGSHLAAMAARCWQRIGTGRRARAAGCRSQGPSGVPAPAAQLRM